MTAGAKAFDPLAVVIRPFRRADLEPILAMISRIREAPHWPQKSYEAALAPNPSSLLRRVARVAAAGDSGPLGLAIAAFLGADRSAELELIVVKPEMRRLGLGSRLLDGLRSELTQDRAQTMRLEVRASNRSAICFYRALGFQETGRRPAYYASPREDALLFERRLESVR